MGVMQIKPSSAAQSPINIRDVYKLDGNIEAGAKFMRFMERQYLQREALDDVTESLFATASYNAGSEKIQTLRKEAAEHRSKPVVQQRRNHRISGDRPRDRPVCEQYL